MLWRTVREHVQVLSMRLKRGWPLGSGDEMNQIIYIVGLIVIVLFILGFLGLR